MGLGSGAAAGGGSALGFYDVFIGVKGLCCYSILHDGIKMLWEG